MIDILLVLFFCGLLGNHGNYIQTKADNLRHLNSTPKCQDNT
uniref:Uncharacterized protein n=1 Tax=Anopheles albimanus TaxID=7167 RepID=A0A182FZ41_ANOAL